MSLTRPLSQPLTRPLATPLSATFRNGLSSAAIARALGAAADWSAANMRATGDIAPSYRDGLAGLLDQSGNGNHLAQAASNLQAECLPLIGGEGYLHLPGIGDNSISLSERVGWGSSEDFTLSMEFLDLVSGNGFYFASDQSLWTAHRAALQPDDALRLYFGDSGSTTIMDPLSEAGCVLSLVRSSGTVDLIQDSVSKGSVVKSGEIFLDVFFDVAVGVASAVGGAMKGAVKELLLIADGVEGLSVNFSNITHQSAGFFANTGQTVTVNQSGTNPAAIIGRACGRFDTGDTVTDDVGVDLSGYDVVSVYQDITTGSIGVRESTVSGSDILATSGTTATLGDHAMFFDRAIVVPSAADTTELKAALAAEYSCSII